MRKVFYLSLFLLLTACANPDLYTQHSSSTQQDVTKIALLEPGMSQEQVIDIMGTPAKVEFSGDNKALHYCNTGIGSDEYAVVVLTNKKVVAARNYHVTLEDTGGATGDCSRFVKSADLQQADSVHEIRFR